MIPGILRTFYCSLVFLTQGLFANPHISGKISDSESGQPLENVVVSIVNENLHTHTDINGKYQIEVPAGSQFLEFGKIGFEKKTIEVLVASENIILNIVLEYRSYSLNGIDIRADRPVSAASSKHISSVDFDNRPRNSAQDMLRMVPGLFIAQHAGGGKAEQIFVRGFDCDHGTDVATYVDGMPVNLPSHGHGQGYSDLHFLIPETVKEMEIFKGPYSPKFGDFATGAAIEFNTCDSLERSLFQIESGFVPGMKSLSSFRELAMLKIPGLGQSVNSYFAVDLMQNRSYFEADQHFKRFNVFSKTTFAINEYSRLKLSLSGFGSSWDASGQIPERAVQQNMITRFGSIDESEGGTTQRSNINLNYQTRIGTTEFETGFYLSNYRFKLYSNFTFYAMDSINGDAIEQGDSRIISGMNTKFSKMHKLGSMLNKLSVGVNFRNDNIENELWHVTQRQRLDKTIQARVQQSNAGLFLNETFFFDENFRLDFGARYDYFLFDVQDLTADVTRENISGTNYQSIISPKISFSYTPNNRQQYFVNFGTGFHSNDARSVVRQSQEHSLPRVFGGEVGTLIHLSDKIVSSLAIWWMDVSNELVYVGDEGTTEDKGPSRRIGFDCSIRYQLYQFLFADVDLNYSHSRFIDRNFGNELSTEYYVPLAPVFTSTGGLTLKLKNGIESSLRYRYMSDRPANETNSVVAHGYSVFDYSISYEQRKFKLGLTCENIFNAEWNEAQFNTESRLKNEMESVEELHFTPGTPLYLKLTIGYLF